MLRTVNLKYKPLDLQVLIIAFRVYTPFYPVKKLDKRVFCRQKPLGIYSDETDAKRFVFKIL